MEVKAEESKAKADDKQPGSLKKWGILGSVVLVAAAITIACQFFGASSTKPVASSQAVLTVELTGLTQKELSRNLLVSGTIWAWDPVQVGSEISGLKVTSVLVEEGNHVKAGQTLAELNNSVLKAQLARQEANLLGARAGLSKAIQPNRPEDLTSLKYAYSQALAAVAQEEANLARAQANYGEAAENAKRYTWLVTQGAVSAQDADNRSTQAKVYQADVHNCEQKVTAAKFAAQQAMDRLHMGETGGRHEDIAISRAQVAQTEAGIAELKSQLAQTVIKAPCDGLIMKRDVHIGDISSTGKVMFEMVRDGRLELRAQVPEADLGRIKPGERVTISTVQSGMGGQGGSSGVEKIAATVREVSPMIDQDTRLGMVRIDLPQSPSLRPGNFVKGEIQIGLDRASVLPASAIVYKDNRAIAYTIGSDNKTQMHFVNVGERTADGEYLEITSGIAPGDRVVAKGAGFLKDGDLVNISGAK